MALCFRGASWRRGPFLDLRIWSLSQSSSWMPQPPAAILRRTFAQPRLPKAIHHAPTSKSNEAQEVSKSPRSAPSSGRPSNRPSTYLSAHNAYTRLLLSRHSPTLLYQAPPTLTYPVTCALIGSLSIAYGIYNFYDIFLTVHPGLFWLVPWLMAAVCVFMLGIGAWILRSGSRLVGLLSAVPVKGKAGEELRVRIETRGLLGRRIIDRPVKDTRLGPGLPEARAQGLLRGKGRDDPVGRYEATPEGRRAAAFAKAQMERARLREGLRDPFRRLGRAVARMFARLSRGIRRVVSREGFAVLEVRRTKGGSWQKWKMDVMDGWCADEGLGLERLLKR
ncbi:MAG: hypothetical protein Q9162_007530 [Coniocarpon cinnabarinum]